jgi:N-ethylmaleimide reductase
MREMKAARIHAYGGPEQVSLDVVPRPLPPGDSQLLVKVRAAGVNGIDWKIRDGLVQDAFPLPFPVPLGIEFVGEVIAAGCKTTRFKKEDVVFGPMGGLGCYAEFIHVQEANVVEKLASVRDSEAAALSVGGLTAYQALFEAGELKAGQRVLIHGSAGGVGSLAVQFARLAGAHVSATASKNNLEYVRNLGADEVFDYRTRFEENVGNIDLVLDLVGAETLSRLWQPLNDTGRLVSTADPEIAKRVPAGRRGQWIRFRPDVQQLEDMARKVAKKEVHVEVSRTFPLQEIADAIECNKTGHRRGKIIIEFP